MEPIVVLVGLWHIARVFETHGMLKQILESQPRRQWELGRLSRQEESLEAVSFVIVERLVHRLLLGPSELLPNYGTMSRRENTWEFPNGLVNTKDPVEYLNDDDCSDDVFLTDPTVRDWPAPSSKTPESTPLWNAARYGDMDCDLMRKLLGAHQPAGLVDGDRSSVYLLPLDEMTPLTWSLLSALISPLLEEASTHAFPDNRSLCHEQSEPQHDAWYSCPSVEYRADFKNALSSVCEGLWESKLLMNWTPRWDEEIISKELPEGENVSNRTTKTWWYVSSTTKEARQPSADQYGDFKPETSPSKAWDQLERFSYPSGYTTNKITKLMNAITALHILGIVVSGIAISELPRFFQRQNTLSTDDKREDRDLTQPANPPCVLGQDTRSTSAFSLGIRLSRDYERFRCIKCPWTPLMAF